MGKRERYAPGTFCWVELATTDPAGATTFYGDLFGWQAEDVPIPEGGTYTMLRLDGDDVAALYAQDADQREQGVPPHWFHYVSVEDADAPAARARELGGTVVADAFDVGDSGRMAVVQDPTGAMLGLWQPGVHIGARRINDPGCLTWNELQTPDPDPAIAFYGGLFGWEAERVEQNGQLVYVTISNAGRANGGIMPMAELSAGVPPHWLAYFTVPSTDNAIVRVRDLGGDVLAGPLDVPTGRIAVVRDP